MKTLTLSIKQKYFDEIVAGTKTVETREIRHNTFDRYCRYVCDGKEYRAKDYAEDHIPCEFDVEPIKYDAIKLLTGAYEGKRPYIVVEVLGADIFVLRDENEEPVRYEVDGKVYVAAEIDYKLGKILEKSL
jgi:hypothetical protein